MRKNTIRTISLLVALIMAASMVAASVFATEPAPQAPTESYEKPDVNKITNFGQEPPELVVKTGAQYFEKQWYEYITYSENAVASYRLDNNSRIVFYDPYDYLSSMIMDVQYDESVGWSTANSITFTHEFSKSFSTDSSSSTSSDSSLEQAQGPDAEYSSTASSSTSVSKSVHEDYSITAEVSAGVDVGTSTEVMAQTTAGVSVEEAVEYAGVKVGATQSADVTTGVTTGVSTNISSSVSESVYAGGGSSESIDSEYGDSETVGWSTVADRVTVSTGSSTSTSTGWSTSETNSISRTFEAAYFNADGAPLTWTIAYYTVKMPMKAVMQQKIGGKWVSIDTDYVLLTTISGSCRAWIENGTVLFEHWGTGEAVADTDFWSGFFTGEDLAKAYKTKLYPNT